MNVLLVGSEGSMGKRYQAILRYLKVPMMCVDKLDSTERIYGLSMKSTSIIISTPTDTHFNYIKAFCDLGKPILCEKPITKSLYELHKIKEIVEKNKTNLTMTMQYEVLNGNNSGPSYYNYFRHGNDGLAWDCMQIIALAKDEVQIEENSPIWMCTLNGDKLSLSEMDNAYVEFVDKWIKQPECQMEKIMNYHEKVHQWVKSKKL